MYDVAVVGLGMVGAAALRYISESDHDVRALGIGPAEPAEWSHRSAVFASHYDQARITRVSDPDPLWAELARRSIDCYARIAQRSGIGFHQPVGHLRVGATTNDPSVALAIAHARTQGAPVEGGDAAALAERFPDLQPLAGRAALLEGGGAGWINPRALVAAQLQIAAVQGADLVRQAAVALSRSADGFTIETASGEMLRARRLLLAADRGSVPLLAESIGLRLTLMTQAHTTVYAQVTPAQATALAATPALIWALPDHPLLTSIYTTPATGYPDGQIYYKIGGSLRVPVLLEDDAAVHDWFAGAGNPEEVAALQEVLGAVIPSLQPQGWAARPCMNSYTAHGRPYIDAVAPGLVICTGGCGAAAKSSDAIGRLGAELLRRGAWADELPANAFRAVVQ